ncbi:MAG: helicase-related protein [Candidatus Heimdallarchaeaceae archaeon]
MDTDLTFITNEPNKKLLDRFNVLIKDTDFFDVLVGYFYTSGFYAIYKSLEKTKRIRILIGISTNKQVLDLINKSREEQLELQFSHAEVKQKFEDTVASEIEQAQDNRYVEEGILKFIDWLKKGKLEIKAYPAENIHAKLYIMTFAEGDRDVGRVITGSSNFSLSGLKDNLEFNVELKNRADYEFAKEKFDELWKNSVDVSEKYIETIQKRTWLNNTISPYELYLKFLYEYFKEDLSQSEDIFYRYVPQEFKKLEYQEQAVLNAKRILEEYGCVFISDVVGLGKTYIAAMLSHQLDGRTLVIAPPVLLSTDSPGSWPNVFSDFNLPADFESLGKLDSLLKRGVNKYKNIIIDEAHRFRTETTISYEQLAQICRGKRVILVTATPYNNSPKDILSQIKLFQKTRRSTIPNLPNLESFFYLLQSRLKDLDRKDDYQEYVKVVKENAKEIRERVLKYLMIRRTRNEIRKYFSKDLEDQKLKFPEVIDPRALFYRLNRVEDKVFSKTIELIAQKFTYARYTPLLYYKGKVTQPEQLAQKNMGKFMKILLIKRLESSFYAFKNTLGRFINSYEAFLNEFNKGNVYVSKKYSNKIFEFLENDDDLAIQKLIDEDKAQKYPAKDFKKELFIDLQNDLAVLKEIQNLWEQINRDPKLLTFIDQLKSRKVLRDNKLIIFTESKETALYLTKNLNKVFSEKVLMFSGGLSRQTREKVIENFDARARYPKDDYRILITTEVLSEGVNLHRSNVVINYDIPWNPTRLMQRVGRINRVDTKYDKIYTFNFFPTQQSNDQIKLKEAAQAKINAFISMLGTDARLLTEGEPIESFEIFNRLMSKKTIVGEDEYEESELKYLNIIKEVRDKDLKLFEKIKRLPKKARTGRKNNNLKSTLLTYFRKGKLQKFYLISVKKKPEELDFIQAAKTLESKASEKRYDIDEDFYKLLDENKKAFELATVEELPEIKRKGGRSSESYLLQILKAKNVRRFPGFTDEDEAYLENVIREIEEGGLPKQTTKRLAKQLKEELKKGINPLKILALLRIHTPEVFLEEMYAGRSSAKIYGPREVILSEYFIGK